ncbi:MAG: hypothetical protein JWO86_8574 [Myxococcaceae bacterium]|nr:hypothetical protein [Myxococcaceae bacterium]
MAPFSPYGQQPPPSRQPPPPSRQPPQQPYYYAPQQAPAKNDSRAIVALVLGLLSMTCMGLFAGIPAIVIGAMSRKEIDRSQGALTGRSMAAGGIVAGLFGTGLSLVILVALLGGALEASHAPEPRTESPLRVPVAAGTRSYGSLDVVDLESTGVLKTQLSEIAKTASGKGRTVILQTYVRSSRECAEVAAALPDPKMQRALANVTLVRVDIDTFENELKAMRVDTESVPWFYKLDANARPTDAISADEWDANIPENMAPVLGDFARGALGGRRSASPMGTAL